MEKLLEQEKEMIAKYEQNQNELKEVEGNLRILEKKREDVLAELFRIQGEARIIVKLKEALSESQ